MPFWTRRKTAKESTPAADTGKVQPAKKKPRPGSPSPLEVKLLAMEGLEAGLSGSQVAEIVGVTETTICAWRKQYRDGGLKGLCRRPGLKKARLACTQLEERILAHRQENPDHGVRRIRDNLRRDEGLTVSAEKVRQTVNAAGLGNPPVKSHRRPAQVRRFERSLPNAMWQIDIFTFQLKRMYKVYLIGVIDDHSRFMVGWGLYRQQTAEAVLEVVKGAIGQWGAPREILSDNGRQFVAWRGKTRFQKVLKQQGIQHVRSAPHHPMTLGKIERFWQTIWREYLEEAVFASFADACQRLDHWVGYYNHQRPHQGIDGACPADRFYGLAEDIEQAVAQGCQENSLRLALGQEPQQPLYLLGQLGGTDVRVTRQGENVEVKVGDTVREVIRMGSPYEIGEDGHGGRPEAAEVEGPGWPAEVPGGGVDPETGSPDPGPVPDVRCEPSDASPGCGCCGPGCSGRSEEQAPWPETRTCDGQAGQGPDQGEPPAGEGPPSDEPALRGGQSAPGSSEESGTRGAPSGREKNPRPEEGPPYDGPWPERPGTRDGRP